MSKTKIIKQITNYLLVAVGTALLAFGSVIFLTELELVAGGVSGIAIIIDHYVSISIYDYVVAGLTAFFWLLGLLFVGKDFAMKTLMSSVLYIGFTFLFKRVDFFTKLAIESAGKADGGVPTIGNYILCGVFGGVFVGSGVAVTFIGGGSTGGVDVIQILLSKYFRIKESLSSFIVDATVIVVGMACMQIWNAALCGILSSFIAAVFIEIVYIKNQTSFQMDIISEKWEDISKYAIENLNRSSTIIRAQGGYSGNERIVLRVVFDKTQYEKIRDYIAHIDPNAFVTITQTNAVYGEGFKKNRKAIKINKK